MVAIVVAMMVISVVIRVFVVIAGDCEIVFLFLIPITVRVSARDESLAVFACKGRGS